MIGGLIKHQEVRPLYAQARECNAHALSSRQGIRSLQGSTSTNAKSLQRCHKFVLLDLREGLLQVTQRSLE